MGYSSNQFYNFASYEGKGAFLYRKPDDNPEFIWPGPRNTNVFGKGADTRMQRGFIRGIFPNAINKLGSKKGKADLKQRRLFFQFNPATIERNVSMSTTMTNPLLQPSVNLIQPVPGQSEFSFELLFDRQAEVVSRKYVGPDGQRTLNTNDAVVDNYKQSDVTELGVLADLYVLDTIIGQSISKDMNDFLKDYWTYIDTNLRAASSTQATDTDTADTGNATTQTSIDFKNWETNIEKNLGNSAFLAPLPIRIVFSSLFMVEGYVQSSSVQFIKFTKNYVPTMCKVTLYVKALYFGFAREKSFVSEAIAQGVQDTAETLKKDSALSRKAQVLAATAPVFKYTASSIPISENGQGSFKADFETNASSDTFVFRGTFDVLSYASKSLSDAVTNGSVTWDFTGKIEICVYSSTFPEFENNVAAPVYSGKYGKVLLSDTLKYEKKNGGSISTAEIANNAVKKNGPFSSKNGYQTNKATFGVKPSFKTIPSDSIIQVKITHKTVVTYTPESANESRQATDVVEDYCYFNAGTSGFADYEKWFGGDTSLIMLGTLEGNPSTSLRAQGGL